MARSVRGWLCQCQTSVYQSARLVRISGRWGDCASGIMAAIVMVLIPDFTALHPGLRLLLAYLRQAALSLHPVPASSGEAMREYYDAQNIPSPARVIARIDATTARKRGRRTSALSLHNWRCS